MATGTIPAGSFSTWLAAMTNVLNGAGEADVPCGDCTACCSSRQFVPIGPGETDTLKRIPARLRFQAPHRPEGHYVLGFDDAGRCPMLGDRGCSIYEHRPRACRAYDCRVFAATGIHPGEDKGAIADRVGRWRFGPHSPEDAGARRAVAAATVFLEQHAERLPEDVRPITATQWAVAAVEVRRLFLGDIGSSGTGVTHDDAALSQVVAALRAKRRPEQPG